MASTLRKLNRLAATTRAAASFSSTTTTTVRRHSIIQTASYKSTRSNTFSYTPQSHWLSSNNRVTVGRKPFLEYYDIPYKIVEVNPMNKKEIKWSDYRKVPILMVDGEQMVNSSDIIDKMYQRMHPDSITEDAETQKWRLWVDDHLVHVLSPNIYRSPSEALESFDYITTKGNFSLTERLVAKYGGAAAMYFVSKKLKKRHNITDERAALYEAADTWVNALNGRQYLGGSEPNLADLSVFGVLRPIRELKSGKDMVENTRIGEWLMRMESQMKPHREGS